VDYHQWMIIFRTDAVIEPGRHKNPYPTFAE
jgi:hypothetical protein